jgi:anthranilate phosphoribosyltransferase
MVYGAALILWHCGRADNLNQAAEQARQVLDNGSARARLR